MPLLRKKKNTHEKKKERAYKLLEEIDSNKPVAQPVVVIKEKEIIKEEAKMANCQYCGALMKYTETKCPHCGAFRKKN